MAGWELALVIMAITFMVVNIVTLMMQVALMFEYKDLITKTVKCFTKVLDRSEKVIDKMFDELSDNE